MRQIRANRSFTFEPPHPLREEELVLQARVIQGGIGPPLVDLLLHLTCRTSDRKMSGPISRVARNMDGNLHLQHLRINVAPDAFSINIERLWTPGRA